MSAPARDAERKYHDATRCPRCGGEPGRYVPACVPCQLEDDGPLDQPWDNSGGYYDGLRGCPDWRNER